ncbi:hypothetical protein UFOVP349_42 [uncultured Caudovirales phage]|uniref:Uncharacterized protein n=1 Tax=uncultured Caudovirales phage TaxID=2100421 RepID=A0A6J5LY99_9CAUD|nr:hypothetical protein UFOVP349_42 [uncultured Caudovirales phage]
MSTSVTLRGGSAAPNRSKLVTGPEQLPLFSLPTCRRDRRMHLARLFWHVNYLDACHGCGAGNGFLSGMVGVAKDHLRSLRRELEELGLIATTLANSNERTIRPLVGVVAAMRAGWIELAWVIAEEIQKAPATLKRMAASLLKNRGPRVDLAKLCRGLKSDEGQEKPRKSSPSLRRSLRGLSSYKECNEETTTIQTQESCKVPSLSPEPAKTASPEEVAAALLLAQKGNLAKPEADLLAKTLTGIGGTVSNIRHALDVMLSKSSISSPAGFLRRAVEAAVAGSPYQLPSSAAPAHAKDSASYRVDDTAKAPREDVLRHQAEQKAKQAREEAQRAAWEALSEPEQTNWVERALAELLPGERVLAVRQRMQSERGEHHRVKATARRLFNESREGK